MERFGQLHATMHAAWARFLRMRNLKFALVREYPQGSKVGTIELCGLYETQETARQQFSECLCPSLKDFILKGDTDCWTSIMTHWRWDIIPPPDIDLTTIWKIVPADTLEVLKLALLTPE